MSKEQTTVNETGFQPIPLNKRESWVNTALVWAGCEFAISVIMTGSGIIASFSLKHFVLILLFSLIVITWVSDGFNSYLGALTGRSSTLSTLMLLLPRLLRIRSPAPDSSSCSCSALPTLE